MMGLKIIHHNVLHWRNHRHQLSNYYLREDPDVITINGHCITREEDKIKLLGYHCVTKNLQHHSGVAILVKKTLRHQVETATTNDNFIWATIHTDEGPLTVATFYKPPRDDFLPLLDLQAVLGLGHPTVVLADANVHHRHFGHRTTDPLGTLLEDFCQQHDLHFMGPNFNTFYSGRNKGRPDIILGNQQLLLLAHHVTEGAKTPSDHLPVMLQLSSNPIAVPCPERPNYNRANWDAFKEQLEELPLPIVQHLRTDQIDDLWTELLDAIKVAHDSHVPKTRHRVVRPFRPSTRTRGLDGALQQRFTAYKGNMTAERARELQQMQRDLDASYREDLTAHWTRQMDKLEDHYRTNDAKQLYKRVRDLMGRGSGANSSVLVQAGIRVTEPQQQAEIFRDTWEGIMTPNRPAFHIPGVRDNVDMVESWLTDHDDELHPHGEVDLNRLTPQDPMMRPIAVAEVQHRIQRLKSKAAGASGINNIVLQHLPERTLIHITRLFNASLSSGFFPRTLKIGRIYLIPKPGKATTDPKNYRPICLLESLAKVMEKILNHRLRCHLINTGQMNPQQYGFLPGKSTQEATYIATQFLMKHKEQEERKVAGLSLDVAKAFDTVWLQGLKYKLSCQFDLPDTFRRLLCSYVDERTYAITHRGALSTDFRNRAGVPQGSALSPTLYIMFVNDVPGPRNRDVVTLQYADDITVLAAHRRLDRAREIIAEEAKRLDHHQLQWLTETNKQKSLVTFFGSAPQKVAALGAVAVDHEEIPYSREIKILGVIYDHQLRFHRHIKERLPLARAVLSKLNRFRGLPPEVQMRLFNTLVLPLVAFNPTPLLLAARTHRKALQILQSRQIRRAHGIGWEERISNRQIHMDLELVPVLPMIQGRLMKLHNKMMAKEDPFLLQIWEEEDDHRLARALFEPIDDLL